MVSIFPFFFRRSAIDSECAPILVTFVEVITKPDTYTYHGHTQTHHLSFFIMIKRQWGSSHCQLLIHPGSHICWNHIEFLTTRPRPTWKSFLVHVRNTLCQVLWSSRNGEISNLMIQKNSLNTVYSICSEEHTQKECFWMTAVNLVLYWTLDIGHSHTFVQWMSTFLFQYWTLEIYIGLYSECLVYIDIGYWTFT